MHCCNSRQRPKGDSQASGLLHWPQKRLQGWSPTTPHHAPVPHLCPRSPVLVPAKLIIALLIIAVLVPPIGVALNVATIPVVPYGCWGWMGCVCVGGGGGRARQQQHWRMITYVQCAPQTICCLFRQLLP
jgi:hypothetical protein